MSQFDPKRQLATVKHRIAKGLLDHLVVRYDFRSETNFARWLSCSSATQMPSAHNRRDDKMTAQPVVIWESSVNEGVKHVTIQDRHRHARGNDGAPNGDFRWCVGARSSRFTSRVVHGGGTDRPTVAMHENLSFAISRLPVPKAGAILRLSGRIPRLHPLYLQCAGINNIARPGAYSRHSFTGGASPFSITARA